MKMIIVFFAASLSLFVWSLIRTGKEEKKTTLSSRQFSYFFLWRSFDNWIDFIVYPFVIATLGLQMGFAAMIVLTFVVNAIYLLLNNQSEEDWTFMGLFNRLRDNDSSVWLLPYARLMKSCRLWRIRKSLAGVLFICRRILRLEIRGKKLAEPIGFLYFSVREDSFCAINYLYHKNANLRDGKVFGLYLLSHVICNLVWLPVAFGISSVIEWILNINP